MNSKKLVCLGAGSLYFRRAISDLLRSTVLSGSELVLYDLVHEKSVRMARMGQRLAADAGTAFQVRAAESLEDALDGADFALSSIGGSGAGIAPRVYMSHYHNADIVIPAKYGIQQVVGDTCGPAGMMMALRAAPVYVDICREMEKRCPHAILLNHSNPMAPLCRAMRKYSNVQVIGVCHGVQAGLRNVADVLGLPVHELSCLWVGTNHYYWLTRVMHQGRDLYPALMQKMRDRPADRSATISTQLSLIYGHRILYQPDDHIAEFYPFLAQVKNGVDGLPGDLADTARTHFPTHDLGANQASPEEARTFYDEYQELLDAAQLPEGVSDNLLGEGIAATIEAISQGKRHVIIANLANNGCIPNLPPTAEVEIEAVTDACGVRGVHMGSCPLHLKGILEKRFVWHELVADAAVKGDRNLALQALMLDEMAILPDQTQKMLEELLHASRDVLPRFFA